MHEFRELAKNVYAFVQPALIWYSAAGVIVGERDVIVVDSLINETMTESLLEHIRNVTDKPVRLLINTHSHPDHVYTNHLFPSATVICSEECREKTREFQLNQALHDETFARLFPDVNFAGGRYTLQDMTFNGAMRIYRYNREIHVIELGPGHSESDVVVYLPDDGIVFCGDLFMKGLAPMPGEGFASAAIANIRKLEDLSADIYVAGHGAPGSKSDIEEQRTLLESLTTRSRQCYDRGMSYDEAMQTFENDRLPVEFARPAVLSIYSELEGKLPASRTPADTSHMLVMSQLARRAEMLYRKSNP